jgi:large subunit ribosomal protein L18
MKLTLNSNYKRIKLKIRNKVIGSEEKPRLSVFKSNKYMYGQLINDDKGVTLVSIVSKIDGIKKTDASFEAGKLLAQKAVEKGIKKAVFDRNGYKYHGRVQKFADGAREGGLEF